MITSVDPVKIEKSTGYSFRNEDLLKLALSHPSWSGEMKKTRIESNQRLEFLGDAVLELVTSEYLYKEHPGMEEGELTRLRSSLVFEAALCSCAQKIDLGSVLLLGKGEELSGGREKASILSDAFEALIGAIYLDGGFEKAKEFILSHVISVIEEMSLLKDRKSAIQELVQKKNGASIRYETYCEEDGANHIFISDIYINGEKICSGSGHTKKAAEQEAAGGALKIIGQV